MKNFAAYGVMCALFFGSFSNSVLAELKFSNPFASKDSTTPQPAAKPASMFSLPKLPKMSLPSVPLPAMPSMSKINLFPAKKPGEPSTFTKMQRGTTDFFYKTADFLNPWDSKPEPAKITGSRRVYDGSPSAMQNPKPQSSSFFPKFSLPNPFAPAEPKYQPPREVNDFLKRARPPIN